MRYLLDTDWVINWMNGKKVFLEKIEELRNNGLAISIISMAEIYEGVYGSKNPARHESVFTDFLSGVTIIELSEGVCKKFGELRNSMRKTGLLIGDFDLLIAATALENNFILLTDNEKHYKKIAGLSLKTSSG